MTNDGPDLPPPATAPGTDEPGPTSKPWWKKWWVITLGVFLVLVVIGGIAGGDEDDLAVVVATTVAPVPETEPDVSVETAAAPTTPPEEEAVETTATEPAITTTSVPAETTTTTSSTTTTTTTVPLTPEQELEIKKLAFSTVFETSRLDLAGILTDDINVETVDKFVLDDAGDIDLNVTSGWASPDNQVDGAWETTRALATLWTRDTGNWYQEGYVPGFKFTNSGTVYNCPGEFMVALGSLEAARSDWEATC